MKQMILLILVGLFLLIAEKQVNAQDNSAGLNGKQFRCRITEITPPDVDRMPMVYEEIISFDNGMLKSEFMKKFTSSDFPFTASIDERRAIAFTVVMFDASGNGNRGTDRVSINYSGNVVAYAGLNGEILISGNGISEKYLVETLIP